MIVFGFYHGIDLIGDLQGGVIKDCLKIVDMPTPQGQVPMLLTFRSIIHCFDMDGNRIKFNLKEEDVIEIKTSDQLKLSCDPAFVDQLVNDYKNLVGRSPIIGG